MQGSICVTGGVLETVHPGVMSHPPSNPLRGFHHPHVKQEVMLSE